MTFDLFKDVRNINEDEIKDFQCVVLLSAISNDPFGDLDPKLIYNPTTEYTLKIAKICKKNKIKFIFPSSCSVYGAAKLNEYLKRLLQILKRITLINYKLRKV